jgi:tetratricopeptide (TPR) repeat protein
VALAKEALAADLPTPTLVALGAVVADRSPRLSSGQKKVIGGILLDGSVSLPSGVMPDYSSRPEGVAALREACRRSPGDFWANYQLASALLQSNQPGEAVPYLTAAVALRPDLLLVRQRLAEAYRGSGDLPAVLRVGREAVAANPLDATAQLALVRSLLEQGEAEQAEHHLQAALRIDPTYHGALRMLPHVRLQVGAWDEALEGYERLLATRPADPTMLVLYASGLKKVGRFDDAVTALRQAHRASGERTWTLKQVQPGEREAELVRQLPGLDNGTYHPRDPAEVWECVRLCYHTRRDRATVRLAERAMGNAAGRARAPAGPNALLSHIYAAARLSDSVGADTAEQARCRALALAWLRAELARHKSDALGNDPRMWITARKTVRLWQQHRDLAPVRDTAGMSELERADWTAFWGEVEDLVRRIDAAGSSDVRRPR